ncbi:hypothetical protein DFH09DRAFT_1379512 [Mycena vulgaris]|nr:hypothetical protein DFH09DRAFT_1379512 [Mycena vulgaris]
MSLPTVSRDKMLGRSPVNRNLRQLGAFLYILELVEVIKYFRRLAYRDGWLLKAAVLFALAIDTLDTATSDGIVYLNTITHWGDEAYASVRSNLIPIFVLLTSVSAALARAHLVSRYYRTHDEEQDSIPRLRAREPRVFALQLAGTGLFAATLIKNPSYDARATLRIPATFWLATGPASDVLIAVGLLVSSRHSLQSEARGFPRLCTLALQSGVLAASFSGAALIIFLLDTQETNLSFAIRIAMGRLYSHAVLRTLNSRAPEEAPARTSLPHTIQLARYPFMADPEPALASTLLSPRPDVLKGGHPHISPPVLIDNPTPENLQAGVSQLKRELGLTRNPSRSKTSFFS